MTWISGAPQKFQIWLCPECGKTWKIPDPSIYGPPEGHFHRDHYTILMLVYPVASESA